MIRATSKLGALLVGFIFLASACRCGGEDPVSDAGTSDDAGAPTDAGSGTVDDAGEPDAGQPADGGTDAGTPTDAGVDCGPTGFCRITPLPHGEVLLGIWSAGATDTWAVGGHGTAQRFDGTEWKKTPTGTTEQLWGVWGRSANDVWAVGGGRGAATSGLILHWDGAAWSQESALPGPWYGVWIDSTGEGWAVGANGVIARRAGGTWTSQVSPTSLPIRAVHGLSVNDAWAVGDSGTLLRFAGGQWSTVTSPVPDHLRDVWAVSASEAWAVGHAGAILKWNGTSWTLHSRPVTEGLKALMFNGGYAVAVGDNGRILRLVGSLWLPVQTALSNLYGLWVHANGDLNVAGLQGVTAKVVGSVVTTQSPATAHIPISKVLSGVWPSAPDDVWFSGWSDGDLYRWNKGAFEKHASGDNFGVHALWGASPNDVWGVGGGGKVVHFDGASWTRIQPNPVAPHLQAIWGAGANDIWAVGDAGAIARWDGKAWSASVSGTTEDLEVVFGFSATDVWAAGKNETFLHWNGVAWTVTAFPSLNPQHVVGMWGSSPSDIWAAGHAGAIFHYDGVAWSRSMNLPSGGAVAYFVDVTGTGPNDVWIVGQSAVWHWDGVQWKVLPPLTGQGLFTLRADSSGALWTTGWSGGVFRRAP